MKTRIGIVGYGAFSKDFIKLFNMHPDVEKIGIAELVEERRAEAKAQYPNAEMFESLDDLLENGNDFNCVAIFTQRHLHAPMVIKALKAGKHVYSAVPIACTVDEIREIVNIVGETRQVYMMGETCYYYPAAIFCREKYKEGAFGKFVYAEAQYYHDIREMYNDFAHSGGDSWRRVAGIPPMFYPTHSISMVFPAINAHAVKVSCFGMRDDFPDDIYGEEKNDFENPFSEQAAYDCVADNHIFQYGPYVTRDGKEPERHMEYVSDLLLPIDYLRLKNGEMEVDRWGNKWNDHKSPVSVEAIVGYAGIHDLSRLPRCYRSIKFGSHNGFHPFLVDDFVRAVVDNKLPPNNAWDSARYMIPGLIAHESALRGGELGKIYYGEISRIRRRGIPTWGKFHIKEHSGGAMIDIGIHVLDAAIWLMGNPKPVSVMANTLTVHTDEIGSLKGSGDLSGKAKMNGNFRLEDMDVETFACGTVNFEEGFTMSFKVAWSSNLRDENNIILSGEKAGVDTEKATVYRGESDLIPLETVPHPYGKNNFYGHFYIIENLAKYLWGQAELLIKPEETLTVTRIIDAVYRSAELGREVRIDEL